jgi:uncharacterized repeat protein (TIGR03806 family)
MLKPNGLLLAFLACGFCACQIDEPQPVPPPGSSVARDHLSELGIFIGDLPAQSPAAGFEPYDVDVSLYSDGASKYRFVHLPPGTQLGATVDRWEIPVGTYLVKTFYFPFDARDPDAGDRLIETRFLVKRSDGYLYSTYLWNDAQTDAIASGGNVDVPIRWIDPNGVEHDDSYHVPGVSQCQSCHADRALGLRTRQMDLEGSYADGTSNQLDHFVAAGLLDGVPDQRAPLVSTFGNAPLDDRARAYLDANCSHCHAPDGEAASTGLYWGREHTGALDLPRCRPTDAVDGRHLVIVPGHPEQSEFLARMSSADPFVRMPRGPVHVPDGAGIAVLSQWVSAMAPAGCP